MNDLIYQQGPTLRARREALGLSRSEIAIAAGRGEESVRRWERGGHRPPREVTMRIAHRLGVPVDLLAWWEDE